MLPLKISASLANSRSSAHHLYFQHQIHPSNRVQNNYNLKLQIYTLKIINHKKFEYVNQGFILKYYRVRMFFNLFSKNYTFLRLEDIFRLKQSFSIHFVSCRSESSNISLVVLDLKFKITKPTKLANHETSEISKKYCGVYNICRFSNFVDCYFFF